MMKYAMKYIVDRIEESIAVLERNDRTMVNVPISTLPPNTKEGDCLLYTDGAYLIDDIATEERKKEIDSLVDELFV